MATISMKSLFEAGVHLGHKTERWHPKMKPYIYGAQSGIYVIDIRQTLEKMKETYDYIYNVAANGGSVLFVGTKFQARDVIATEAARSNNPYVNLRWLGGMLTNFNTVKQSISKLKEIEVQAGDDNSYPGMIKKEAVRLSKARKKLDDVLGGIRDMKRAPSCIFIIDTQRESIAIKEAKKLNIPIVAVVDTNCDPRDVDHVIPGNDDSVHCIELFTQVIAAASIEGRKAFEQKAPAKAAPAAKPKEAKAAPAKVAAPAPAKAEAPAPAKTEAPAPAAAKVETEAPAAAKPTETKDESAS